jgi:hypothetical protein
MNMKYFLAALLLVPALAMPAIAMARTNQNSGLTQAYESGREIAAPPWSFACTNDQGPRQSTGRCGCMGVPATSRDSRMRSDIDRLAAAPA